MNKISRFYNKNRKIIWISVFVIVFAISIPRALNNYAIKQNEQKRSSSNVNITTTSGNKDNPVISGGTPQIETTKQNKTVIDSFIEYCNNGSVDEAYKLLSNNCKEKLYPTIDEFKERYFDNIFKNKKIYDAQAWYNSNGCYTYKINLSEDILATGNANGSSIEEYYTIVNENGENKLNINGFINSEEINKKNENDNLEIAILSKDIYMDYEIYNLNVKNKTRNALVLDGLKDTNTMFLLDNNGLHYYAYNHELVKEELRVRSSKNISIKFNKKYTTKSKMTKISFTDIILNYDNNETEANKENLEVEI